MKDKIESLTKFLEKTLPDSDNMARGLVLGYVKNNFTPKSKQEPVEPMTQREEKEYYCQPCKSYHPVKKPCNFGIPNSASYRVMTQREGWIKIKKIIVSYAYDDGCLDIHTDIEADKIDSMAKEIADLLSSQRIEIVEKIRKYGKKLPALDYTVWTMYQDDLIKELEEK